MIQGEYIANKGAVIPLQLRGVDGAELDVNGLIDNGFTASMTLPTTLAVALGLKSGRLSKLVLADGSIRRSRVYSIGVLWNGNWRSVLATALGDEVLVGMRMLAGHRLQIDAVTGGTVEITRLP